MDHSLLSYRTSTVRILKLRAGLRQAIHDSPPTFSMRSWDWDRVRGFVTPLRNCPCGS